MYRCALDLEWDTGWAILPRLQFGVRHNNRDASREERRRSTAALRTRGRR